MLPPDPFIRYYVTRLADKRVRSTLRVSKFRGYYNAVPGVHTGAAQRPQALTADLKGPSINFYRD